LEDAVRSRGDDLEAQHRLAQLCTHRYRLTALQEQHPAASSALTNQQSWQETSPAALHARVHQWASTGDVGQLELLRNDPRVRESLAETLEHLLLARRACFLAPEVHEGLGALWFLVGDPSHDAVHLERVRKLAPGEPAVLFRAGLFEYHAGRFDRAWASWQESLLLGPQFLDPILRLAETQLTPAEAVEKVLPDSPEMLIRVGREHYASETYRQARWKLGLRLEQLALRSQLAEEDRWHLRGVAAEFRNEHSTAIVCYRRAVSLRLGNTDRRYELARLLKEQGRLDEAHQEAKCCAQLAPDNMKYRELLAAIHRTRLLKEPETQ
jgi:tetratricopeptide (TPR) repeat protein